MISNVPPSNQTQEFKGWTSPGMVGIPALLFGLPPVRYAFRPYDLDFPTRPNVVWVADFTFIRITSGFCYLDRDSPCLQPQGRGLRDLAQH